MAEGSSHTAAVTGGTNVGGIVGSNSGTLTNAYNSTAVSGSTYAGNVVGTNAGDVTNVFDVTNNSGSLIGLNDVDNDGTVNNSYSTSDEDNKKTGIKVIDAAYVKDAKEYSGFDTNTWKFYDGYQTPLLKVFLTSVSINANVGKINEYINNVYNGR